MPNIITLLLIGFFASCIPVELDDQRGQQDDSSADIQDQFNLMHLMPTPDERPAMVIDNDYAAYDEVNWTRLVPEAAAFHGVAPTAVEFLDNVGDPGGARNVTMFSYFQEIVRQEDARTAVQTLCSEEYASLSLRDCIKRVISKAGTLTFELFTPAPKTANDPRWVDRFFKGTLGFKQVRDSNNQIAFQTTCLSCHMSATSYLGSNGQMRMHIDRVGTPTHPDAHYYTSPSRVLDLAREYLADENRDVWNSSPTAKVMGLLFDQYSLYQHNLGQDYNGTDADLLSYADRMDVSRVIGKSWVLAGTNLALAGKKSACHGDGMDIDSATTCEPENMSIDRVMERAGKRTVNDLMRGGSAERTVDAILSRYPDWMDVPETEPAVGLYRGTPYASDGPNEATNQSFRQKYVSLGDTGGTHSAAEIAVDYLYGATNMALLWPQAFDSALVAKWFPQLTVSEAREYAYSIVPRANTFNYAEAFTYFRNRYTQSDAPSQMAYLVRMTFAELSRASAYVNRECGACHDAAMQDPIENCPDADNFSSFASGSTHECNGFDIVTGYNMETDSPVSEITTHVMRTLGDKVPLAMERSPETAHINQEVKAIASRISLFGRLALLDWGLPSFADALASSADFPERYAVMSTKVDLNGESKPVRRAVPFSLSGPAGSVQDLSCAAGQTIWAGSAHGNVDCKTALREVLNYLPRSIKLSDVGQRHLHEFLSSMPHDAGTTSSEVARYLEALGRRGMVVVHNSNPNLYKVLKLNYDPENFGNCSNCDGYSGNGSSDGDNNPDSSGTGGGAGSYGGAKGGGGEF